MQVAAFINGPIVHAADLERQSIGLRRYQQISAKAAEFAREAVSAIPTVSAATAKSFRRGLRMKDSPTRRANI